MLLCFVAALAVADGLRGWTVVISCAAALGSGGIRSRSTGTGVCLRGFQVLVGDFMAQILSCG